MIATLKNASVTSPTFLLRRALSSPDSNSKQLTNKRLLVYLMMMTWLSVFADEQGGGLRVPAVLHGVRDV